MATERKNPTEEGFLHWQVVVSFDRKVRLKRVKYVFGSKCHCEPSKSTAANDYVWKDETSIEGTRFELGALPIQRGDPKDWDAIVRSAKLGLFEEIPSDVLLRYYGNIKRLSADFCKPAAIQREIFVYWGATNLGKSRRAWDEAGMDAYPKDPRSKFWDGYRNQPNVVIDEFRGGIDIAHMLRWLDRYPVIVEVKGSSVVLQAQKMWITSNLHPRAWYPQVDPETMSALLRRFEIFMFFRENEDSEILVIKE